MLDESDTVPLEESVALVIVHRPLRRMVRLAVYLQDAPFPVIADEEVGFAVDAPLRPVEPCHAEREEQHSSPIQSFGDLDLGRRTEAKVLPKPEAVALDG